MYKGWWPTCWHVSQNYILIISGKVQNLSGFSHLHVSESTSDLCLNGLTLIKRCSCTFFAVFSDRLWIKSFLNGLDWLNRYLVKQTMDYFNSFVQKKNFFSISNEKGFWLGNSRLC